MPLPSVTFTGQVLQPQGPAQEAVTRLVHLPGLVDYPAGQVLGLVTPPGSPRNEIHRLTVTGSPAGGSIRLHYLGTGGITGPIDWNADPTTFAANIQAALEALESIGDDDVSVTGATTSTGFHFDIEYQNDLGLRAIPAPIPLLDALTGGATVAIARQQTGHGGEVLAAAYDDNASDGTQTAKLLLMRRTRTDMAGFVIDERGPSKQTSATVYSKGRFRCSDLVGLDANGAADLGRLINANAHTQDGAVLFLR